jgi:Transposase, Mutator family
MASAMPRRSQAKAVCPRVEHAGSRVRFDGTYGTAGHRRQRYKCVPANGDRPHVFTELLPREESWRHSCDACERHVPRHEGPQAPRKYQFVARGIAAALVAVGAGQSYMRAAHVARLRARRQRTDATNGSPRASAHGQLVADWVEVFAPVVFVPHRPSAWQEQGTVVLDHMPFRVRAFGPNGRPIPGGRVAFDVFCAMGYEEGKPKLWKLEAFTDALAPTWERFLGSLPGQPQRVVCDAHYGLLGAIEKLWPQTDLYLCEWHLQHALRRLLRKQSRKHRQLAPQIDPLIVQVDAGTRWPVVWERFKPSLLALGLKAVDDWVATNDPILEWQFARRGWRRPPSMPLSTGGLEQLTRPIRDAIHPRRYAFKNRERMNRLLMLMQLHANGLDSHTEYAKTVRDWLLSNDGRPKVRRRAVTDRFGFPSLR